MDLATIRSNFVERHNLIREADIGDETQVALLDSASMTVFQAEISALLQQDYASMPDTNVVNGAVIKQYSDINVKQRESIDDVFTPLSNPFNFALVTSAKEAANQVLSESIAHLFKSASV